MRKPKKPRFKGATNNIAKAYIYQIIILMVPMTAVFGIFLYLVFINAPLYVLGIVGFVGPLTWFMSIISIYYSAKGALADKENFAPVIFTDVDGNSIPYWTYASPNVTELGTEDVQGMTVAGKFYKEGVSKWHKNEVIWPETIMLPNKSKFFRKSWVYTPTVWDSCYRRQGIFTASRGLPVTARGIPLATMLITEVDVDHDPAHIGEPVPICILTNCWYLEKMRLKMLGKQVPTEESIGRIKESVALRKMQSLMLEMESERRFSDSMADEVVKERQHAPKIVGQALKAIETLDEEPSTVWDKKWIIIGIIIIAVSVISIVALWGSGVIRF